MREASYIGADQPRISKQCSREHSGIRIILGEIQWPGKGVEGEGKKGGKKVEFRKECGGVGTWRNEAR